jgi:hypothetical protein
MLPKLPAQHSSFGLGELINGDECPDHHSDGTTVKTVSLVLVQSQMLDNVPQDNVEWLAGEESKWVPGQIISASGG